MMLINVKMPIFVGILAFMSMMNCIHIFFSQPGFIMFTSMIKVGYTVLLCHKVTGHWADKSSCQSFYR